jgi:hypothetical protein
MSKEGGKTPWPALVLGGVVALSGANAWLLWDLKAEMARELAVRPPIAVLESMSFIQREGETPVDGEGFKAGLNRATVTGERLARQGGYLVLDSQGVSAAPEALYVRGNR